MHVIACCSGQRTIAGIPLILDPKQPKDVLTLRSGKNEKHIQLRMQSTEETEAERDRLREQNAQLIRLLSATRDKLDEAEAFLSEATCVAFGHSWGDYGCEVCNLSYREWRDASQTSRPGNGQGQQQ